MRELTPTEWLRVLTKNSITAEEISMVEGCSLNTARKIIQSITDHRKGLPWVAPTDTYLKAYRQTDRKTELALIYGDTHGIRS